MSTPETFLLLTIPNTTVSVSGASQTGILSLECVTIQVPYTSNPTDRDVYLVLRLGAIELQLDPAWIVQRTEGQGHRTFSFQPTESDPIELVVSVAIPSGPAASPHILEDVGTLETILAQYMADLRSAPLPTDRKAPITPNDANAAIGSGAYDELRGHLIVVNQDNGEVVAQFDKSTFHLDEDPKLHEPGHENDVVIIEVPDRRPGHEQDATALQMFARAVPPDQQDWITKSATIARQPSPYHSQSPSPAPPPGALAFLTSEQTRKGLEGVHAVSSQAVKVSSRTVSAIDGMTRRVMGSKQKRERQFQVGNPATQSATLSPTPSPSAALPPPLPARTPSPSYSQLSPSPGYLSPPPGYVGVPPPPAEIKPPLPPRRSPSPVPPLPPRAHYCAPAAAAIAAPQPRAPLSTKERMLLSADLIFSTLDHNTRRLLDTGTASISSVIAHKYGPEAAQTSQLLVGTARNAGLIYVDMRGIGRRALLKSAGVQFIKGRM
ncbi:hypothetical protein C0991_000443 [Blastosporella zonata]|nr:hypothetical protein C0991_000443 [Blastosporella zonata]